MNRPGSLTVFAAAAALSIPTAASGQGLLVRPEERPAATPFDAPGLGPGEDRGNQISRASVRPLVGYSTFVVEPPEPKIFKKHDVITIIVDESSRESSSQRLDTEKDYNINAQLNEFISLEKLLELQLRNGANTPASIDVSGQEEFEGRGNYERTDRLNTRISATVIDVKPNGLLVVEARKTIQRNRETTTIVLSGTTRSEDVTRNNTVLSSQLADLVLITSAEGDVDKAGRKGWISRVLGAVFDF